MTNEKAIMCLEDMKIKVPIPKAAKQARENNEALDVAIKALQSAEPKTGEWIEVEVLPEVYDIEGVKTWGSKMQCDQCGFRFMAIEGHITQYNFCPNCGCRMDGGE